MVGVPGRSKGCKTCRKRKIKCSLERPYCLICISSGRSCEGFGNELVFVTSTASSGSSQSSQPNQRWRPDSYHAPSRKPLASDPRGELPLELRTILTFGIFSYPMFRQQLLVTYTDSTRLGNSAPFGLLSAVISRSEPTSVLELATHAYCSSRLARTHLGVERNISAESQRLYVAGLRALAHAINDFNQWDRDETLAACLILTLYEMHECPSGDQSSYLVHTEGFEKLMVARGPAAFTSGLAHSAFLSYRSIRSLEALNRRRTILEEEEWKTIPYKDNPKQPYDLLLDKCLEAPALMNRAAAIFTQKLPTDRLRATLDLTDTIWRHDGDLCQLFEDLKEDSKVNGLYGQEASRYDRGIGDADDSGEKLFSTKYVFPNLRSAMTITLYWSMALFVATGLVQIYDLLDKFKIVAQPGSEPELRLSQLPSLEGRHRDWISTVRDIMHSMEYAVQDHPSLTFFSVPLNICRQLLKQFPGNEKEKEWVARALERISMSFKIVRQYPAWRVIHSHKDDHWRVK